MGIRLQQGRQNAAQGRLGGVDGLQRVVQPATARGFAVSKRTDGVPAVSTGSKQWIEGGFVYETDHLGRTTKGPLATAPLRQVPLPAGRLPMK